MPTMYEIYERHAVEYDELVNHEDYQGNLRAALHELHNFTDSEVIEFGSGTGRVTKLFIDEVKSVRCFDRASHMHDIARQNLGAYADKITFSQLNNLEAHTVAPQADVVIEGWSFGHTVNDDAENYEATIDHLVSSCEGLVRPGRKVIIIETLGTNTEAPFAPNAGLQTFFDALETKRGYAKTIVPTDYKFSSVADGVRIMGFFFGDAMKEAVKQRGTTIIPEFTGIWSKTIR